MKHASLDINEVVWVEIRNHWFSDPEGRFAFADLPKDFQQAVANVEARDSDSDGPLFALLMRLSCPVVRKFKVKGRKPPASQIRTRMYIMV